MKNEATCFAGKKIIIAKIYLFKKCYRNIRTCCFDTPEDM